MTSPTNIGIKAIVTAGGTSERFGSNKLLERLSTGKSVIETTIKRFLPYVEEVIVPCGADVQKHLEGKFEKVVFALPGATRQKSVYSGLLSAGACKYVLIHDGARAFVDEEIILKTIDAVKAKNAVVVGVKAIDTIKICDETGKIVQTPDRTRVYHAQTPQAFLYEKILEIHKKLSQLDFTDDAGMVEHLGQDVFMVEGKYSNIKITVKADLERHSG